MEGEALVGVRRVELGMSAIVVSRRECRGRARGRRERRTVVATDRSRLVGFFFVLVCPYPSPHWDASQRANVLFYFQWPSRPRPPTGAPHRSRHLVTRFRDRFRSSPLPRAATWCTRPRLRVPRPSLHRTGGGAGQERKAHLDNAADPRPRRWSLPAPTLFPPAPIACPCHHSCDCSGHLTCGGGDARLAVASGKGTKGGSPAGRSCASATLA